MAEHDRDIFDKIMSLPILNILEPFFSKYREGLLYLFFGGLAFVLNIALFVALNGMFGMNELTANILCWIACVLFQFTTNRTWVFHAETKTAHGFLRQAASFFSSRILTLIIEEAILALFITWLGARASAALGIQKEIWDIGVKLFAQTAVIILNFVLSKLFVFKKQNKAQGEAN